MHGVSTAWMAMRIAALHARARGACNAPGQAAIARELTACIAEQFLILGWRKYRGVQKQFPTSDGLSGGECLRAHPTVGLGHRSSSRRAAAARATVQVSAESAR